MISYGKQSIDQEDIDAVVDVLKSSFLTKGPVVQRFEQSLASYTKANFAVATTNGTSALHLACLALGIGYGDEVWVPAITFVATANCALYCGAKVKFIDCDSKTGNIDVDSLQIQIELSRTKPKAIIVVHMAGNPCDMRRIAKIAAQYECRIIEDAAHALGGKYETHKIGACKYSDVCTLSFHPVKSITTGEGGALLTNDKAIYEQVKQLNNHGFKQFQKAKNPWDYDQVELGYNYRMSDIHAALGCSQLAKVDRFIEVRAGLAERYRYSLQDLDIQLPNCSKVGSSAWHLYIVQVPAQSRRDFFLYMKSKGVNLQVHYVPLYHHEYHYCEETLDGAELFYQCSVSLPLYPSLRESDQDSVITLIRGFYA